MGPKSDTGDKVDKGDIYRGESTVGRLLKSKYFFEDDFLFCHLHFNLSLIIFREFLMTLKLQILQMPLNLMVENIIGNNPPYHQ